MKKYAWLFVFLLAGCNEEKKVDVVQDNENVLSLPALPIIESSVMTLNPIVNGQTNHPLAHKLCELVNDGKSKKEIRLFLFENKIDIKKNPGLEQFSSRSKLDRLATCAAMTASQALTFPNYQEFLVLVEPPVEPPVVVEENKTNKNGKNKKNAKGTQVEVVEVKKPVEPQFKIDTDKLQRSLATKLAVAQTNIDIFSLIASRAPKNLTLEDYRVQSIFMFKQLSPVYQARFKHHYQANLNFQVTQMSATRFEFVSSNGYQYAFDQNGLLLKSSGINLYGEGQLMGKMYYFLAAYYPMEMIHQLKNQQAQVFVPAGDENKADASNEEDTKAQNSLTVNDDDDDEDEESAEHEENEVAAA